MVNAYGTMNQRAPFLAGPGPVPPIALLIAIVSARPSRIGPVSLEISSARSADRVRRLHIGSREIT